MTDAPQPPPGWEPPNPPTAPPPPPPTSPAGYPPPPPPTAPPGWAAPQAPATAPPPPGGGMLPPPPGTPGYGYAYTPSGVGQAKPLGGLATALSILLGLTALAAIGVAGALANRASLLEDPFGSSFEEIQDADDTAAATAALYLLLFLASGVLWIIWQFRHAKNAEALGKHDGLGAGWAIGGWFIPFANLILGPLQLLQSAKWSDPDSEPARGKAPPALIAWWVLLVLQFGIGMTSNRLGFGGNEIGSDLDLEEFRSDDQLGAVGALVTAVTGVVAIVMVRSLSSRQREALHRRGTVI